MGDWAGELPRPYVELDGVRPLLAVAERLAPPVLLDVEPWVVVHLGQIREAPEEDRLDRPLEEAEA